ncbi:hypothetical protein KC318_g17459, partial [Hortaea werneckii]
MPSFHEWLNRPKVHVDWHSYGICLYWMLGGHDRCYALQDQGHCKFVHPPLERISELWTDHDVRLEYATKNPADPRWRPVMRMDEPGGDGWADGDTGGGGYGYERAPPPSGHHVAERTPPARRRARSGRLKSTSHRRNKLQAKGLDASTEPLSKANKLLDRGNEDVPSAAARTVWKGDKNARDQVETDPSTVEQQSGQDRVIRDAAENEHAGRLNAAGEVQRPSPPKEEGQASVMPEAADQPVTGTDVRDARNAMPPPRLPLAGKATPYNKRSPPLLPPPPDRNAKAGATGPSAMAGTKRLSNGDPKPASAP